MQAVADLVALLSGWVWGPPMLALLVGTGLYYTVMLKGLQISQLPRALKLIFHKETEADGDISHFAALMTALAATVGIGNIVGVATAITMGGPGAVFWMWMTGFVGMATKYGEAVLAVKYREAGPRGFRGGPMYYLAKGANLKWLGVLFAVFAAFATFGIGNMVQANAVSKGFEATWGISPMLSGAVMMVMTGVVLLGGVQSIARFTSVLVPVMIVGYVGAGITVMVLHAAELPAAFALIFNHAFAPSAAQGGFAGAAVAAAMRYGIARGVFSNESGLGSAPIVAAAARTNEPVIQALVSMTQTFIDTLVVCTMTAMVILTNTQWTEGISAAELTTASFAATLGPVGQWIVVVAIATFAYSTLIGWSYYGERAIEYLVGEKVIPAYRLVFVIMVFVGAVMELEFVWNLSDLMNGLMALPNLIALVILAKVVREETQSFLSRAD